MASKYCWIRRCPDRIPKCLLKYESYKKGLLILEFSLSMQQPLHYSIANICRYARRAFRDSSCFFSSSGNLSPNFV